MTNDRGSEPAPLARRVSDRTLWLLLALGVLALIAAIGFALWINAQGPLQPVPVASRPTA